MSYLFLDTTSGVRIALWEEKKNVFAHTFTQNAKGSQVLHSQVYQILKENNLSIEDLKGLIYIAGPGSYTGMRLSVGFADILKWQEMSVYSFYHFEVPHLVGVDSGQWFSTAFKGEYFLYEWEGDKSEKGLFSQEELMKRLTHKNIYSLNQLSSLSDIESEYTNELILKKAEVLFPLLISKKYNREAFYYRNIDEEFKKPK